MDASPGSIGDFHLPIDPGEHLCAGAVTRRSIPMALETDAMAEEGLRPARRIQVIRRFLLHFLRKPAVEAALILTISAVCFAILKGVSW